MTTGLDIRAAEEIIRKEANHRLNHTLGVRDVAVGLARIHGVDAVRVEFAALLHDWAKELPAEEIRGLIQGGTLQMDAEALEIPKLHHSYLSAYWIESRLGVHDEEVLEAVRYHPTGVPGLRAVGQVVFVADYVEPGRDDREAEPLRRLARENLSQAVQEVLKRKIIYLMERSRRVHSNAWLFWNEIMRGGAEGKR